MLILASILIHSTVSFAGYKCQDRYSTLSINPDNSDSVQVQLTSIGERETQIDFSGQKIAPPVETYNQALYFALKDLEGNDAQLIVRITPLMGNCHSRRYCAVDAASVMITAQLDYQGKVTLYGCQAENI